MILESGWGAGHAEVAGNIRIAGGVELSCLELFNYIPGRAVTSDDHADAGSRERLMGIRATIAGQHELHVLFCHQLPRLDAGASTKRKVWVLDDIERHGFGIDNHKTGTAAKPRVYLPIQRYLSGGDSYFHENSSCPVIHRGSRGVRTSNRTHSYLLFNLFIYYLLKYSKVFAGLSRSRIAPSKILPKGVCSCHL